MNHDTLTGIAIGVCLTFLVLIPLVGILTGRVER